MVAGGSASRSPVSAAAVTSEPAVSLAAASQPGLTPYHRNPGQADRQWLATLSSLPHPSPQTYSRASVNSQTL